MKYPYRHVLVVDDDVDTAENLSGALERWLHCRVRTAYDGTDAIELAALQRPDAVVLKADLPGVSGAETAAVLRRLFRRTPPKLIAYGNAHRHREPRPAAAFDAWLEGPSDLRALLAELVEERPEPRAEQAAGA
jgi:two-component system, OmpR family, response regulator